MWNNSTIHRIYMYTLNCDLNTKSSFPISSLPFLVTFINFISINIYNITYISIGYETTCTHFWKFEILKILNIWKEKNWFYNFEFFLKFFWNFWKFWNLHLFLDNVETLNRSTEAHARWTHSEVQPRKYCLGHSANSKIPYHLIII